MTRSRLVVAVLGGLVLVGTIGCGKRMSANVTSPASEVEARRDEFRKAYNAGDTLDGLKALCDILHENVSFRGKFQQGQWTRQRDNLIKRWTRDPQIDCKNPRGKSVGIRVIGANEIVLNSSGLLVGSDMVVDTGTFDMRPVKAEGQQFEVTNGPYMMIWVKNDSNKWTLKYIDMDR